MKSAKRHLVALVGAHPMYFVQMVNIATRVEACLNSRPLVAVYDAPDDTLAITPGDILIGETLITRPEPSIAEVQPSHVKHWVWRRRIQQEFWRRWHSDYLQSLQARGKWYRRCAGVQLGDVVAVKGDNLPPTHWLLGKVTELHPGPDGLIRNATLKTARGVLTRPVQRLCLLLSASDEPPGSAGEDVRDRSLNSAPSPC